MGILQWTQCMSWTSWRGQVWYSQHIVTMRKRSANSSWYISRLATLLTSRNSSLMLGHLLTTPYDCMWTTTWCQMQECIQVTLQNGFLLCYIHVLCSTSPCGTWPVIIIKASHRQFIVMAKLHESHYEPLIQARTLSPPSGLSSQPITTKSQYQTL